MLDASAGNVNSKLVEAAHQMTETIASLEDRCEVLEKMVVGETDHPPPLHSNYSSMFARARLLSISISVHLAECTHTDRQDQAIFPTCNQPA
jgi:hypothetical protein